MAYHKTMKPSANPFLRPACWVAVLACCSLPVQAGTLYWDGTTSTVNADGGNGTTDNWDTLATDGTESVWTTNNIAVFGSTAGTVSLGTGVQFDTAGCLVQSNALPAA
jgi:hypothetical protein